jgi:hypothetical protein
MDPKSLASNTAALLGLTIQVTGALYENRDKPSGPTIERLLYELARLRTVLASLEEASLESDASILLGNLPKVFRALREALIFLGSKLLGDGETIDIPTQSRVGMQEPLRQFFLTE